MYLIEKSKKLFNGQSRPFEYLVIVSRFTLSFVFARYGYSKLTGAQFGISEEDMLIPISDLSLFKVSWYLFQHEPFRSFIGMFQMLASILLLFNRTALIGAFLLLPITLNILIIDISFMEGGMRESFVWRLLYYLTLNALILGYYREKIKEMIKISIGKNKLKHGYPLWLLALIPIIAIGMDIFSPKVIYDILCNIPEIIEYLKSL